MQLTVLLKAGETVLIIGIGGISSVEVSAEKEAWACEMERMKRSIQAGLIFPRPSAN